MSSVVLAGQSHLWAVTFAASMHPFCFCLFEAGVWNFGWRNGGSDICSFFPGRHMAFLVFYGVL